MKTTLSLPALTVWIHRTLRCGALFAITLFAGGIAKAATWTGTTDGTWANASNWGGTAPVTGNALVFTSATGAGGTALTDNLMTPGTFTVAGITFNAGAAAFVTNPGTAGTNGFTLTTGITNSGTNLETINDLITITTANTMTMTTGGGNITLGGNISGTGGSITTAGTGTLTLSGSNTYTGTTTVGSGTTLTLEANAANTTGTTTTAVGTGNLTLNSGGSTLQLLSNSSTTFISGTVSAINSTAVTFNVNNNGSGSNQTIGFAPGGLTMAQFTLNVTGAGNGYTLALGTITSDYGGPHGTFPSIIIPVGASVTIAGLAGPNNDITLDGNTTGNAITGAVADDGGTVLTKSNTSTWTLDGANTYTGGTTISGGTLIIGGSGDLGSENYAGAITDTATFNYASTAAQTLSGGITGTGGIFIQSGTGVTTLTGTDTYTGGTTITAGTVDFTTIASMPTTGTISVASGATIAVGVGAGPTYFTNVTTNTAGAVGGLLNGTATGTGAGGVPITYASGAIVGLDTTNATAGTFTYAADILNAGANTLGLTKLGTGTLVLTGSNAYTGTTLVRDGTLVLTGSNTAATGQVNLANGTTLQLQANAGNTNGTTSFALGTSSIFVNSGLGVGGAATVQLLSNSSVTFSGGMTTAGYSTGTNNSTLTFYVNNNGSGTNQTISINPGGLTFENSTLDVTGGNGYTLALGTMNGDFGGGPYQTTIIPTTASVTIAGDTANDNIVLDGTSTGNSIGAITNTGGNGVRKQNTSTWTLTGSNTYTGGTTVTGGTLIIAHTASLAATGTMTIGAATLQLGDATAGVGITQTSLIFTGNGTVTDGSGGASTLSLSNGTTGNTGGAIQVATGVTSTIGANVTVALGATNTDINSVSGVGGTLNLQGTLTDANNTSVDGVTLNVLTGGAINMGNFQINLRGTNNATVNVEGGTLTTPLLVVGNNQAATATLTVGLGGTGGTITAAGQGLQLAENSASSVGDVFLDATGTINASSVSAGIGTSNFFFNGGTLGATAANATFMTGLTDAYVGGTNGSGGAVINNGGFDITIGQALLTGDGITGSTSTTSDDGGLLSEGAGMLTLTGANTYTGGTTITGGGIVKVASESNLGTGGVTLNGGELLTSATTTMTEGVALDTAATNTLAAAAGTTATYSGVVADGNGAGALTIGDGLGDTGTVSLTNTDTYTGGTTVSAGTLNVATTGSIGTAGSSITVISGATLLAANNLTASTLINNGTIGSNLALGTIPSFTVTGNLTINSTGIIVIRTNGATADQYQISGGGTTMFVAGSTANIVGSGNTPPGGLVVLDSPGGLNAAPTNVTGGSTFQTYTLTKVGFTLVLNAVILNAASYAQTPNEIAVANAIDPTFTTTGLPGNLGTAFNNLTGAEIPAALDQLSPEVLQYARNIAFENSTFLVERMNGVDADLRGGYQGLDTSAISVVTPGFNSGLGRSLGSLLASDAPAYHPSAPNGINYYPGGGESTPSSPSSSPQTWDSSTQVISDSPNPYMAAQKPSGPETPNMNMFLGGDAVLADLNQNQSTAYAPPSKATYTALDATAGISFRMSSHLAAGVLFDYNRTDANTDSVGSKTTVASYSPGLFATYFDHGFYANGLFAFGYNKYSNTRDISFANETATSHPTGQQYVGDLDFGYDFHPTRNWVVGPTLGITYTHLNIDSFMETGAPGADLDVASQSADSLRSRLGAHVVFQTNTGDVLLQPNLTAMWQHEYLDNSSGITSSFNDFNSGPFTIETASPSRDSALIGVGMTATLSGSLALYLNYFADVGASDYFAQSVVGGFKAQF